MSAFGCQPRVRWPNENYKHPGGGCLLPSKPVSALVSNPKAAQSRGGEGLEQEQGAPSTGTEAPPTALSWRGEDQGAAPRRHQDCASPGRGGPPPGLWGGRMGRGRATGVPALRPTPAHLQAPWPRPPSCLPGTTVYLLTRPLPRASSHHGPLFLQAGCRHGGPSSERMPP